MKGILNIVFLLFYIIGFSQIQHDSTIQKLVDRYNVKLDLSCNILVETDVEGMIVPDKEINLSFDENGKPKFKGKGIGLLPKRGILNQYKELLSQPFQAIFLGKQGNNMLYKLVALDQKSEWITADLSFDETSLLIDKYSVSTKKHGTFHVTNTYEEGIYPSKSVITFNVQKFKFPIKFIGRQDRSEPDAKFDENVEGRVTLHYTYLN